MNDGKSMIGKSKLICDTVARLMELSVTAKETDGTDIFVDWSPHCDGIHVRVFLNGWKNGSEGSSFDVFLDEAFGEIHELVDGLFTQINECLGRDAEIRAEYKRLNDEADKLAKQAREAEEKAELFRARFIDKTETEAG